MPLKLSDEQVLIIRQQVAGGTARRDLAIRFGVSVETISRIVRGDSRTLVKPAPEVFDGELSPSAIAESERRLAALVAGEKAQKPATERKEMPALLPTPVVGLSPEMQWLLDQ